MKSVIFNFGLIAAGLNEQCKDIAVAERCADGCAHVLDRCIVDCKADSKCVSDCMRTFDACENACPCYDGCRDGCPCASYDGCRWTPTCPEHALATETQIGELRSAGWEVEGITLQSQKPSLLAISTKLGVSCQALLSKQNSCVTILNGSMYGTV